MKKKKVLIAVFLMCLTFSLQTKATATPHIYNPDDNVISGNTFTDYDGNKGESPYTGYGGVIMYYKDNKSHTLEGSTFTNNKTGFKGLSQTFGGAIYSSSGADLTINDSIFSNNYAYNATIDPTKTPEAYGGAIVSVDKLTINNSKFSNNFSSVDQGNRAYGGAIFAYTDAIITNTDFTSNSADIGGAIFQASNKLNLTGGSFTGNKATYYGGAIYANSTTTLDVDGVEFADNKTTTSTTTGQGGAIYTVGTSATIKNASFTGNSAGSGGAILTGKETDPKTETELTVTNTVFSNNSATGNTNFTPGHTKGQGYGGAISAYGKTTITDASFDGNTATTGGGAIQSSKDLTVNGNTSFINNTVGGAEGNDAASLGGAIYSRGSLIINEGAVFEGNKALLNPNYSNSLNGAGGAICAFAEADIKGALFNGNEADLGGALFVSQLSGSEKVNIENTLFSNNKASSQGGAIDTTTTADITIKGSNFENNTSLYAGAVGNFSKMEISDSNFNGNQSTSTLETDGGGGAMFLGSSSETTLTNVNFNGNKAASHGGAIATRMGNNSSSKLNINGGSFTNNSAALNGGAIATATDMLISTKAEGTETSSDVIFAGNTSGGNGGAIYSQGADVTVTADGANVTFTENGATDGADLYMAAIGNEGSKTTGTLTLNAKSENDKITLTDGISGDLTSDDTKYKVAVNESGNNGSVIFNSEIKNADMTVSGGTLHLAEGNSLNNSTITMQTNSTLDTTDGAFTSYSEDEIKTDGNIKLKVDINSATGQTDHFGGIQDGSTVTLADFNPTSNTLLSSGSITLDELKKSLGMSETINLEFGEEAQKDHKFLSPLRWLNAKAEGNTLAFAPIGNNFNDFNPSVMAAPVAAQIGGYLNQLNSYDEAFRNMDMYMLMTKSQRQALKNRNKYAAADSNLVYDPTNTPYENTSAWFRPYATFENVKLKGGPKVSNVAWGSFFGADSELIDLGNGWDGMFGAYLGYNGSHQAYNGIDIYQNGATLGLVGMAYKDNYFAGLTANVGSNIANADTMYGSDDFTLLMSGIAAKTGYNWELAEGRFIIQPSYMMSYSFVNTFDYTNSAGIRVNSDPLNAITFEPGVKFIGNLNNGWQPYAGVSVVWNVMDKTQFQASDATLPELSVKPFVKYGIGIRKTWGERLVGFFQTFFTNGGRNGVGLQAGVRWTLGDKEPKHANSTGEKKIIAKK